MSARDDAAIALEAWRTRARIILGPDGHLDALEQTARDLATFTGHRIEDTLDAVLIGFTSDAQPLAFDEHGAITATPYPREGHAEDFVIIDEAHALTEDELCHQPPPDLYRYCKEHR